MGKQKNILKLDEAAKYLGVSIDDVKDLVSNGDLPAIGSQKTMIKRCDLLGFIGNPASNGEIPQNVLDNASPQRSNPPVNGNGALCRTKEERKLTIRRPHYNEKEGKYIYYLDFGRKADGRRDRKKIKGDTEEEAMEKYYQCCAQREQEKGQAGAKAYPQEQADAKAYPQEQDILFCEHYRNYLKYKSTEVKDKTYQVYVQLSRYILDFFGNYKLYELNHALFYDFFAEIVKPRNETTQDSNVKKQYFSQSTLQKIYILLKGFTYKCAMPNNPLFIKDMPDYMQYVKKPSSKALGKEIKAFTDEEMESILKAVESDLTISCWVHILAETGVRPSEALALTWNDVSIEPESGQAFIYINKTLGEEFDTDIMTGKKSKTNTFIKELKNDKRSSGHSRHLSISAETLGYIRKLQENSVHNKKMREGRVENATTEYIFTSPAGKCWTYKDYLQKYKRLLKKAGIQPSGMNPYRFRQTFCTYHILNGTDPKSLQILMGDSSIEVILKHYAKLERDEVCRKNLGASARMQKIYSDTKEFGNGQTVANL